MWSLPLPKESFPEVLDAAVSCPFCCGYLIAGVFPCRTHQGWHWPYKGRDGHMSIMILPPDNFKHQEWSRCLLMTHGLHLKFGQILWFSFGRKNHLFPKQLFRNQKHKARRICSYWNPWKTSSFGTRSSRFFISIPQMNHCLTLPGKNSNTEERSCESKHPVSMWLCLPSSLLLHDLEFD